MLQDHGPVAVPAWSPTLPRRIAFVGQGTFFAACSLEPDAAAAIGLSTRFIEFRQGADAGALRAEIDDFAPDAVVVFRPEILPRGIFHDLPALVLGFLTEPLPRSGSGSVAHEDLERRLGELRSVDPGNIDRVVSFDPHIARSADSILPVWRSVPLPVADRFFRDVPDPVPEPRPFFVGRSTPHRERMLEAAKAGHEILHIGFGVDAAHLEQLFAGYEIALNVHNHPYPTFENRVCLHLAAGHLVLSEPLHPRHGLEPGLDYLELGTPSAFADALTMLERAPGIWHDIRLRGRRKAELYRASRVYPRLLADLMLECRTPGSRRPGARAVTAPGLA